MTDPQQNPHAAAFRGLHLEVPMRATPSCLLALALAAVLTPAPAHARPLGFRQAFFHEALSRDGLQAATDAIVSPDGAHVYVAGRRDDAVAIFARDLHSGLLAYRDRALWSGVSGGAIPDLNRPFALAISPDAVHVYAVATDSDSLVVFERDPVTGGLGYRDSYLDEAPNAAGNPLSLLQTPVAVKVSPDGAHVYVATIDDTAPFDEAALLAFARAPDTGLLTPVDAEIEGAGGPDVLARARDLDVSPDGANVYLASLGSEITGDPGAVLVFDRDAPTGALAFRESQQDGIADVAGLENPRDVEISPDGAHVYVADGGRTGAGAVTIFERDAASGALAFFDSIPASELGITQPNGIAITPDGGRVLVIAQGAPGTFDSKLAVFERDPATGALVLDDVLADGVDGAEGLKGALQVDLSPDGQNAYVSSEQDLDPAFPPDPDKGGALAVFVIPEPAAAAGALAAVAALAQRSHSRGRRKTSVSSASGVPGAGRQS